MAYFSPKAIEFLKDLSKNNDRAWFETHQPSFERYVREPCLTFIEDAVEWLEMAGYPYGGTAKKSGGALSRVHRDTRFSKDKTPYHTHIVLHFQHKDATKAKSGPVIGLRFDAKGEVGMGGGLYGGDTKTLNRVRDAIVANPDAWAKAKQGHALWGDSLKTAPNGYVKNHALIEDIRRKAFMVSASMKPSDFTRDVFGAFQHGVTEVTPFLEFLEEALL
jgi:uncharacterized protein (TIGR02453 family)